MTEVPPANEKSQINEQLQGINLMLQRMVEVCNFINTHSAELLATEKLDSEEEKNTRLYVESIITTKIGYLQLQLNINAAMNKINNSNTNNLATLLSEAKELYQTFFEKKKVFDSTASKCFGLINISPQAPPSDGAKKETT